jgi:protein-S-isoprenylcysteine O-methyltransferase Ste14
MFVLALFVIPISTLVIAIVYLRQYRMRGSRRWMAVIAHSISVAAIIGVYGATCVVYYEGSSWQYPGWLIFLAGSALFWYAVYRHPAALTPKDGTQVVRSGPYNYIRHPIYSGGLVGALGLLGVAPSWQLLTVWLVLLGSLMSLIFVEERELKLRMGSDYTQYCNETRLLIPWII